MASRNANVIPCCEDEWDVAVGQSIGDRECRSITQFDVEDPAVEVCATDHVECSGCGGDWPDDFGSFARKFVGQVHSDDDVVLYDQNTLASELRHIFRSSPIPSGQRKGSNKLPRNPFEATDECDAIERVAKERNVPAGRLIAVRRR